MAFEDDLKLLLELPRQEQLDFIQKIRVSEQVEEWNTKFGEGSLYQAWANTSFMRGLYQANSDVLQKVLKPGFRIFELGGGDGSLWKVAFNKENQGDLVLIDPVFEVHEQVKTLLPPKVNLDSIIGRIEDNLDSICRADAVVISLMLHHVAGKDRIERKNCGLNGPGKIEILQTVRQNLNPNGIVIVNEADVYCDIGLKSGDPILADRIIDSYVRRTVKALLEEIKSKPQFSGRYYSIIKKWCLDQIDVVYAPIEKRDVYELDVIRWLEIFNLSGFEVIKREFTDKYGLFCQYVLKNGDSTRF